MPKDWLTTEYMMKSLIKLGKMLPDATDEEVKEAIQYQTKYSKTLTYKTKAPQCFVARILRDHIILRREQKEERDRYWRERKEAIDRAEREEAERKRAEKEKEIQAEIAYSNWLTEQSNLPSGQHTEMPEIVKEVIMEGHDV